MSDIASSTGLLRSAASVLNRTRPAEVASERAGFAVIGCFSQLPDDPFDVCIVGSGPVGLALAHALGKCGNRTVVLEAGGTRPDSSFANSADACQSLSADTHAPLELSQCQAIGGASWLWGGRCLPLDENDLEPFKHEDEKRWPISRTDCEPYFGHAAEFLDCGTGSFEAPGLPELESKATGDLTATPIERWSNEPRLALRAQDAIEWRNVTVVTRASVCGLELDTEGGTVKAVKLHDSAGRPHQFNRARVFVIACGALENARLLLNTRADGHAGLFGGQDGPLGRYYMGHLTGRIADLSFATTDGARAFDFHTVDSHVYRRRLAIAPGSRHRHCLPNVSFEPKNPQLADPSHHSGVLSAAYLVLANPLIGRRLVAEAIRLSQMQPAFGTAGHIRNLLCDLPRTITNGCQLINQRLTNGRRKPVYFELTDNLSYPLQYHGEHQPSATSGVTLASETDSLGRRRLNIDLQFADTDIGGVLKAHRFLRKSLARSRFARLDFRYHPEGLEASIRQQAYDGFHQIGLTRMGHDRYDGVVDKDCRVFDLKNLYVAGSSVFRTSGQANPTFFAVALAQRLADHLDRLL